MSAIEMLKKWIFLLHRNFEIFINATWKPEKDLFLEQLYFAFGRSYVIAALEAPLVCQRGSKLKNLAAYLLQLLFS